jgi:NADH:ubiquinone oxidoreductase subunit 6 (subunit J)
MSWLNLFGKAGSLKQGEGWWWHSRGSWRFVASDKQLRELESAAKRDGAERLPGQYDILVSQYEQQIVLEGKQRIQNSAADVQEQDALLYPRFAQARTDYRVAFEQYASKKAELGGRPVNIRMSSGLYWPLVSVMSVCEVVVNKQAFDALFGEAIWMVWLAAIVLAIVLIFAAHSIGGAVQQRGWANVLWAIVLGTLTIGLTFGLAYLRMAYINYDATTAGAQMSERPKLNAEMVTNFFVAFNLLFLTLAAWMAAKLHDEDETYEQRYKTYLKTREKLVRIKQQRDSHQRRILRDARAYVGLYRTLISSYRDLNMQNRAIKATPRAWVDNSPQVLVALEEQTFTLNDNVCGLEEDGNLK